MLLPVAALLRRADGVAVIGRALEAKVCGQGHRSIAAALDRPPSTVRSWLCTFTARAEPVRSAFTTLLVAVAGAEQTVLPAAAGTGFGDAVSAVLAVAVAARRRFGQNFFVNTMSAWLLACAVTNGYLLAPPMFILLPLVSVTLGWIRWFEDPANLPVVAVLAVTTWPARTGTTASSPTNV